MDITELTKWIVDRGDDLYSISTQVQFKKKLDKYFEAINYSRCCTELKYKKRPTFEKWCEANGIENSYDCYIYRDKQVCVDWLVDKYVEETDNI